MSKFYARCSLGKNRAFWCVWDESRFDGKPPLSCGYETTLEAAEARAREVAGEGAHATNSYSASHAHRFIIAERRRNQPAAKGKDSHKVEYVYTYQDGSDSDYPDRRPPEATAYRVYKTTKTRLFVEDRPGLIEKIERGLYPDHDLRTFTLDREEFESEGRGFGPAKKVGGTAPSTPHPRRRLGDTTVTVPGYPLISRRRSPDLISTNHPSIRSN